MPPDYAGGSVVNVVAELERRLAGSSASLPLHAALAGAVPPADGYVLVLFDGLGAQQLGHRNAAPLRAARRAVVDAAFPTTTTTNLATVATGLAPSLHGLIGYQLWLPEVGLVVNTIKWTTLWGDPVDYPYDALLPAPNLWERLAAAGAETITVQPAHFAGTPLSRALYRRCRFEPAYTAGELVEATLAVAGPGRLVFTYVPHVDFAAHTHGQASEQYDEAVGVAAGVWERLERRLPGEVALVGIADHGHVDFPPERQHRIPKPAHDGREFFGDGRVMFVNGEGARLAESLPARWVPRHEMLDWWGPEPRHPSFAARAPDGALVADDGWLLLHRWSDDRLVGNHGGLTPAERRVPLLAGATR